MTITMADVRGHPVFQTLNPVGKDFMQDRMLSKHLNRFVEYGIEIYGLIPFGIFPHIKTIATIEMMLEDFAEGRYEGKHTLVVDSSGNTGDAAARLAPAFGFKNIKVVLATDVPKSKQGILSALSTVKIIAVPGSVAECAIEEGSHPGHFHLNQYAHMGNMHAHEMHTGPAIIRVLGGELAVVAIAMGSGGTAAGVGKYLKQHYPHIKVIGVRPKLGEQVPGARDERRMAEVVRLPWRGYVDAVIDVSRKDAFIATRRLWSEMEPRPGPTSGLAYAGLLDYLGSLHPSDYVNLENIRPALYERLEGLHGYKAAFICPDDGRFYTDLFAAELDTDQGV